MDGGRDGKKPLVGTLNNQMADTEDIWIWRFGIFLNKKIKVYFGVSGYRPKDTMVGL